MLFCWPNLLFLFVSYYLLFFFLPGVGCVGLGSSDWYSVLNLSGPDTAVSILIVVGQTVGSISSKTLA